MNRIIHGDCLDELKMLEDNSIDAIVTDPPYGISFMSKKWDYDIPGVDIWRECLRVLKPGGHLLSFGGTRTYHRMACAIEDAGFEIRDMIEWVYGSGFPKSLNIGKAVDKLQGNEREVTGYQEREGRSSGILGKKVQITRELSQGTSEWEGWGTALKPAHEPIVLARKPISEKTIAANVLKYGTGAINIDGCRVETNETGQRIHKNRYDNPNTGKHFDGCYYDKTNWKMDSQGRYPANLIHDGSPDVVGEFPETGASKGGNSTNIGGFGAVNIDDEKLGKPCGYGDKGSSARYFKTCEFEELDYKPVYYCPKASKSERNKGAEHIRHIDEKGRELKGNFHSTVKPIALMRYLCRMITPPGGIVLDPFSGSGTTGCGAVLEGFDFIGIEREGEYVEIAKARIEHHEKKMQERLL